MPGLATYAHRYLMSSGVPDQLRVEGLLGSDPKFPHWVFVQQTNNRSFREVEGTGFAAVVLSSYESWSTPSQFQQSVKFPKLNLTIYADCSRDSLGNYTKHNGADRAMEIFDRVFPLFHDAANRVHWFDELRVISTLLGSGPSVMPIPDGDESQILSASFNVQI